MKQLPEDLRMHLETGATTLCWCWRLTRNDGTQLGFTDHDRDLAFDGTTFEAAAGFEASELKDSVGLSVDNLEVSSALSSNRLEEADLAAGLYDDAKVEIFRVNWNDPAARVLMRSGSLGEVKRAGKTFAAEVRGLAHYLQQTQGRIYQFGCDADVGDNRCKVNLNNATFSDSASIDEVISARKFTVTGLDGFNNNWFARGLLTFTSGAADGQSIEIKTHSKISGVVTIELWQPAREPVEAGQTFDVKAGCDKDFKTCQSKFNNAENYRGFPHMPGNDFLTKFARPGADTN